MFLDAAGESGIDLVTSDDKLRITLDESGTEIQVSSDGSISIRSQRDISITSQAGITIEAGGTLALKGRAVDVDGNMITLN